MGMGKILKQLDHIDKNWRDYPASSIVELIDQAEYELALNNTTLCTCFRHEATACSHCRSVTNSLTQREIS